MLEPAAATQLLQMLAPPRGLHHAPPPDVGLVIEGPTPATLLPVRLDTSRGTGGDTTTTDGLLTWLACACMRGSIARDALHHAVRTAGPHVRGLYLRTTTAVHTPTHLAAAIDSLRLGVDYPPPHELDSHHIDHVTYLTGLDGGSHLRVDPLGRDEPHRSQHLPHDRDPRRVPTRLRACAHTLRSLVPTRESTDR